MRQSLMQSFDDIYVLDLHGNSKKRERCPDGSKDENVFDIQQGVAIGIFVKRQKKANVAHMATVHHAHLWGPREVYEKAGNEQRLVGGKYYWLANNDITKTDWIKLKPQSPLYLFRPQDTVLRSEYESLSVTQLMPEFSLGCLTKRDNLVIGRTKEEVHTRILHFIDANKSDAEAVSEFGLELADHDMWNARVARTSIKANDIDSFIKMESFRPFDARYIFYHDKFVARLNRRIMHHLDQYNLALVTVRQLASLPFEHIWVTSSLSDQHLISVRTKEGGAVFPLYLYPDPKTDSLFDANEPSTAPGGRRPNLSPAFIADISGKLNLQFVADGKGDLQQTFGPEDVFHYMYAVFHSPTYRTRYAEFLKIDFPRLPLTTNVELFRSLCKLGERLVELHLLEKFGKLTLPYPVNGNNVVEKIEYLEPHNQSGKGRVYINKTQYFEGVPLEVWNFHIGGYQVCHKWLKDRKGRRLTFDDLKHYQRIVAALAETITLMEQVDEAIRGAWRMAC